MTRDPTVWTTQGTTILCNGTRAVLNGMCYSPTPHCYEMAGRNIGDWFHDGCAALWNDAQPTDRGDLALMAALGVTHLRVYFWWEWQWPTQNADEWVQSRGWRDTEALRFDHKLFLDACADHGISVAIGLAVDGPHIWSESDAAEAYLDLYKDTAAEIGRKWGGHPAVMGLCVGNEQNQRDRNGTRRFWDDLGAMARAFKAQAPDKLTMAAFQDDPALFKDAVGDKSIARAIHDTFDICGLNIYADLEQRIAKYRTEVVDADGGAFARPLIVSEWGVGGGKNTPNPGGHPPTVKPIGQPEREIRPLEGPPYGNALAREFTEEEAAKRSEDLRRRFALMAENADIIAGSQYFAWSDEWWKNRTDPAIVQAYDQADSPLQRDDWGRYRFEGGPGEYEWRFLTRPNERDAGRSPDWPEECWGLFGIAPNPAGDPGWTEDGFMYNADVLTRRPTVDALAECFGSGKPRPARVVHPESEG